MSRHTWDADCGGHRGFYRDRENGWFFGVCAGIAEFGNLRTGTVRLITVICLLVFFWPTLLVYGAAVLLFREKPLTYSGRCREYEFWRRHGREDYWSRP